MARKSLIVSGIACNLAFAGCTTLPDLDKATGGILVNDIVLRTKCELSDAFLSDRGNWLPDYPSYRWLQNWGAQADLTLQVLDQATFAPGASVMQPLHNAYPNVGANTVSTSGAPGTAISAVQQSFAVAAGASLNGQAQRTETMSFNFSVAELREWRSSTNTKTLCAISDNADLRGRLGLREWFQQAIVPVVGKPELLYAGYHPKLGSGATTPQKNPSATEKTAAQLKVAIAPEALKDCKAVDIDPLLEELSEADDTLKGANEIANRARSPFASAASNVTSETEAMDKATKAIHREKQQYRRVLDPAVKRTADENEINLTRAGDFGKAARENVAQAKSELEAFDPLPNKDLGLGRKMIREARTALSKAKDNQCNLPDLKLQVAQATEKARYVLSEANIATRDIASADSNIKDMKKYVDAATEFSSKPIDAPIASIGQSVEFILSYGGNVTPTWSFVTFKGPNSPLFSSSGTRTHTLIITLGPTNLTTNAPNADVKQNQFYLQLNSVLRPQM
jgi:hypothetical protein